jgi:hypothetical protein
MAHKHLGPKFANSFFSETLILMRWNFKNIHRTPELFLSRLVVLTIMGFMMATMFIKPKQDSQLPRNHKPHQLLHLHRLPLLLLFKRRRPGLHSRALNFRPGVFPQRLQSLVVHHCRSHHLPSFSCSSGRRLRRHCVERSGAPRAVLILLDRSLRFPSFNKLLCGVCQLGGAELYIGLCGGDCFHSPLLLVLRLLLE